MANELVARAAAARHRAIAPYSHFKVGAALKTTAGKIFDGCNIENASYNLTVCAERVALLKALSEGERDFVEIAVVTDTPAPTPPCGPCRQLLWEFCGDLHMSLHSVGGEAQTYRLSELLPHPFDATHLKQEQ
jgi:cytidine deaminase